jgi:hypothetical protein
MIRFEGPPYMGGLPNMNHSCSKLKDCTRSSPVLMMHPLYYCIMANNHRWGDLLCRWTGSVRPIFDGICVIRRANSWRASIYWNQGRWMEAEELDVQAMEIRKRALGGEHLDTQMSMNNLALTWTTKMVHLSFSLRMSSAALESPTLHFLKPLLVDSFRKALHLRVLWCPLTICSGPARRALSELASLSVAVA